MNVSQLKDRVRNILQLETAEFVYRDLVYRAMGSEFLGIVTRDTRVLAEVKIRVVAGIDVRDGLDIIPFKAADGSTALRVILPRAKILVVDADEKTIHQYMLKEYGFLTSGKISLLEFNDQLKKNKESVTKDSIRRGILDQAENNARRVVSNLLSLAGFTQVDVEFSGAASGSPDLPGDAQSPASPEVKS